MNIKKNKTLASQTHTPSLTNINLINIEIGNNKARVEAGTKWASREKKNELFKTAWKISECVRLLMSFPRFYLIKKYAILGVSNEDIETVSNWIELKIISIIASQPAPNTSSRGIINVICLTLRFSPQEHFTRFQFYIGKWLKFNIYWRRYVRTNYRLCKVRARELNCFLYRFVDFPPTAEEIEYFPRKEIPSFQPS